MQLFDQAGIPIHWMNGGNGSATVEYAPVATQAQRDQGEAIIAGFDWTRAADRQAEADAIANESAIGTALDNALSANLAALNTLTTWRTTGPGAGTANLTAAQSSAAVRQMADNQAATLKQLNGLIRLLRRKLDTSEGAALKLPPAL